MLLPDAPVTIDIGSFSVKVAQARGRRGGVRAIRFAEQRLPDSYHWEAGANPGPLLEAIRQAIRQAGIRSRRAVIALPRRHVIVRISAFPPAERAQLQRVIEVDLSDHIPFPVEQVVVDFQVLGPSLEQPGMVDVLVVAAPRELVRQYLDLARALGMRLAALTIDSFALHDLVLQRHEERPGVTLAIEVGRRATTVNVSEGKRLRLTRSIPLGSQQLSTALREDFTLSAEEAEVRRLTQGLHVLEESPRPTRVATWLDNLRGEMRRSALSFGQAAITRIYLAGAAAHTPGFAQALETEFGIAPIILSPIALFPTAQLHGPDPGGADRCLLAIGYALRTLGRSAFSISLVPREVSSARRHSLVQRFAVVTALALLALLTLSYLRTKENLERKVGAAKRVAERLRTTESQLGDVAQLTKLQQQLQASINELEPARAHRYTALELLKTISEGADPGIILVQFSLTPEQPLRLRGSAPSPAAAADLQAYLLRYNALVKSVTITNIDRTRQARGPAINVRRSGARISTPPKPEGEERVNFVMTVKLTSEGTLKVKRSLAAAMEEAR